MAIAQALKDPAFKQLIRENKEHENFISRIKLEVANEVDNIADPVPLFDQLTPASEQM